VIRLQKYSAKYQQSAITISKRRFDASGRSKRSFVWHRCRQRHMSTRCALFALQWYRPSW